MTGANESQNTNEHEQYDLNINPSLQSSFHISDNGIKILNEHEKYDLNVDLSLQSIFHTIDNGRKIPSEHEQYDLNVNPSLQISFHTADNGLKSPDEHEQYDLNADQSLLSIFHTTDTGRKSPNVSLPCAPVPILYPEIVCDNLHQQDFKCDKCEVKSNGQSKLKKHTENYHPVEEGGSDDNWPKYNIQMLRIVEPIYKQLANEDITPAEAATQFNNMLSSFLETKPEVVKDVKQFFKHNPRTEKEIKEAKKLKIDSEKKARQKEATQEEKKLACDALRHYDYLLKEQKLKAEASEIKKQEKDFKKNFHKFAKETTKGSYNKPKVKPTFTREEANRFYREKYSTENTIDLSKLSWFPQVEEPRVPYDLTPYTQDDITKTLKQKSQNSAPGDDEIIYRYLSKLPSTHTFLATLFTSIRDKSQAPQTWASSKIILLSKDDENKETGDPNTFRMISLTANVGKLYHTLEASRTINFMITNEYLDPSAQKAYIQGINGCVEHIQVVQETIQHAKANNKTAHITWFDLQDAFGSLPHMLIPHVFSHYHIPEKITSYIQCIYSQLEGRVKTEDWESEIFKFLRGAFQGDPYSGIIFLILFNPLIEYIKQFKETHGYNIKTTTQETKIITTPFADDFNLITKNKKQHQKLIRDIEIKAKTMGFSLKPSKCFSLSICGGNTQNVRFVMRDPNEGDMKVHIETASSKTHKFLGSLITYSNNPKDFFEYFKEVLEKKMSNIEASKVRGEHKLAIYERYALPSLRYHLSVHDMHNTHLDLLDNVVKKYLKIWLNFPSRGVTHAGIYHPYLLRVKEPSQLYAEGHASNLVLMRMKGDETVNACIDSKIEREGNWSRKSSTIVKSQDIIAKLVKTNKIVTMSSVTTLKRNILAAKKAVKKSVSEDIMEKWNDKVKLLTMQGDFLGLLAEEQQCITWQSIIRKMPRNVMAFATRLCTNSLNSPDNLVRWGKRKMGACPLCSCPNGTLGHITNFCPVALQQGRYTWRHNNVLQQITSSVKHLATEDTVVYADLEGLQTNGTTIPADILVSSGKGSKPDLVLINRERKVIALMELTCTLPSTEENATTRKSTHYAQLQIALEEKGYTTYLVPFEICSNGYISKRNKTNIEAVLKMFKVKLKQKTYTNMSQLSLLSTMSIFYAYQTKEWVSPPLLSP